MNRAVAGRPATGATPAVEVPAPAKLTLSLRVVGVRPDGYHLLESEMVSLDLADTLMIRPGDRLHVRSEAPDRSARSSGSGDRPPGAVPVPPGPDNLVTRALRAVDRRADVELVKRIPPGAGLGGGSADAAAVLRWAGCDDPSVAVRLGADVPFCVAGGRALVRGVGEELEPLPFEPRSFTLLLLPFGMDTAAVYRAWDALAADGPNGDGVRREGEGGNDLEAAALAVDGRLVEWKQAFAEATGRTPRLAGSGSTWFVEGTPAELALAEPFLSVRGERGRLVAVRSVPAQR